MEHLHECSRPVLAVLYLFFFSMAIGYDKCPLCCRYMYRGYAHDGVGYPICTELREPPKQPDCLTLVTDYGMKPSHIFLNAASVALEKVFCDQLKKRFSTDASYEIATKIIPWLINLDSF